MPSSFASEFNTQATKLTADLEHRAKIQTALKSYEEARDERKGPLSRLAGGTARGREYQMGGDQPSRCLPDRFCKKLTARGTKVFWAGNGQEARDYIVALAKEKGARTIIKSKTMTSEEIHLNEALREAGYEVVESDLGEFIVQLRGKHPITWCSRRCI